MMFPVVYAKCRQCFLVCLAEVSLFPGLSFTSKSNQEKKTFCIHLLNDGAGNKHNSGTIL